MMREPPKIETVDGIGSEFLGWARDTIVELSERLDRLERGRTEPTNARWANLTHWIVVAPLRGCECVPRKFDDGTEVTTPEEAVQRALWEMDSQVDWADGGQPKEGLELLVFERGTETARFVVEDDPRRIDPLPTPQWDPVSE